jgi:hypothetical protein
MVKWMLVAALVVVAAAAVVIVVGLLLPRTHVASRTLTLRRSPIEVWTIISDPASNRDLSESDVPVDIVESVPPSRLVSRIADPSLPFGGTWTFALSGSAAHSTLTITENGFVSNPIFRFVSRFVIGHHATLDTYLTNLAKKFNEDVALSGQ